MLGPRSGRLRGDDNLHVENRGDRRALKGLVGRSESFRKEPGLSSLGPELEDKGSHAPANKPLWKGEPKLSPLRDIEANAPLYAETGTPPARAAWRKCGDGKSRLKVIPAGPQARSWPPAKAKRPHKGAELTKPDVRCRECTGNCELDSPKATACPVRERLRHDDIQIRCLLTKAEHKLIDYHIDSVGAADWDNKQALEEALCKLGDFLRDCKSIADVRGWKEAVAQQRKQTPAEVIAGIATRLPADAGYRQIQLHVTTGLARECETTEKDVASQFMRRAVEASCDAMHALYAEVPEAKYRREDLAALIKSGAVPPGINKAETMRRALQFSMQKN